MLGRADVDELEDLEDDDDDDDDDDEEEEDDDGCVRSMEQLVCMPFSSALAAFRHATSTLSLKLLLRSELTLMGDEAVRLDDEGDLPSPSNMSLE